MTTLSMQAPSGVVGVVQASKSGLSYTIDSNGRANIDTRDIPDLLGLGWIYSGLGSSPALYTTAALQSAAIVAANMAGADCVNFENTGTTPGTLTTDTAAAIIAAIPNAFVGLTYELYIRNSSSGANTATIAGGVGVTINGTATIAQNVTRKFTVKIATATTITMQSMGVSAAAL